MRKIQETTSHWMIACIAVKITKREKKKGDPLQTYNILLNFPSWSSPKDNKINQKIEACLNQSKRSQGTTSAKVGG